MPTVSIRHATLDDTATVALLVHSLLDELSGGKAPSLDVIRQTTATVLVAADVVALIATVGEKPVGLLTLNACIAIYAGGKFGEISELYVSPGLRSNGIAPQLLARAVQECHDRGWKRLEVGAPRQPTWKRTLDFYLRNGFEEVGPRLRRVI